MKYRFRIDTPWGKKGLNLTFFNFEPPTFVADTGGYKSFAIDHPEKYPDLFEPVEESDVERLAKWLAGIVGREIENFRPEKFSDFYLISNALINRGVNVDKLLE